MKKLGYISLGLFAVFAIGAFLYFSGKTYVITIPEEVIQQKLGEKLPLTKSYLLIFEVTLNNPRVDLKKGSNRINAGLDVELDIRTKRVGKRLTGKIDVTGALQYHAEEGAFYLAEPIIETLSIQGLPEKYAERSAKVIEKALTNYYSTRPIYTLKASDVKQAVAKLVLKDMVIQEESIVVTLGL